MKSHVSHSAVVTAALAITLACALPANAAPSVPSAAGVDSSRLALSTALRDYAHVGARVDEASRRVAAASAELDRLILDQTRMQRRLDLQVAGAYRLGDASFITLLLGATNFDDFVNRWYFLTRVNQQSAATLATIKADRQRTMRSARGIILLQAHASAELRALDSSVAHARAALQTSSAAYAEYQLRAAANAATRKAAAARAEIQAGTATTGAPTRRSSPGANPNAGGSASNAGAQGWTSALVSNYGPGSYGHRTANGTLITADSMIVAHKTLPFGTLVEFEYGGLRAVAVVADRGPYVAGREFDLGPGIARALGLNGVYTVRYRIIGR